MMQLQEFKKSEVTWCSRCLYPSSSAVPLTFDPDGLCSGCVTHDEKDRDVDWNQRREMLAAIFDQYRSKGSNYDCVIPVGGGKDSYFQTHLVTKEFGLKPLLVTYHANNYLPEGQENLDKMRHVFDCDHIILKPSEPLLIKMNRKCFYMMGDMNWHAHCGILTYPVQIAVKFNVPLIVWGEHGFSDVGGMYSMHDLIEMTKRHRTEHGLRGYDWQDMIDKNYDIGEKDLLWAKYPDDEELESVGVRGIHIGNYIYWDANKQTKLIKQIYGWQEARKPFERTYRRISNLDDMHENGIHDYLKFIKFGYGRATDHASKDIRLGVIAREAGIKYVKEMDHIKSSDLFMWLEYVNMTEVEFDCVCDSFREPSVWWLDSNGEWEKHNIWDAPEERERKSIEHYLSYTS